MYDGTAVSDCPLPCDTVLSETRFLAEQSINQSKIDITFAQQVQVTTTFLMGPTLSSFLSSVGGSMGLWLGLGVVQAVELVINFVLPWIRACRSAEEKK